MTQISAAFDEEQEGLRIVKERAALTKATEQSLHEIAYASNEAKARLDAQLAQVAPRLAQVASHEQAVKERAAACTVREDANASARAANERESARLFVLASTLETQRHALDARTAAQMDTAIRQVSQVHREADVLLHDRTAFETYKTEQQQALARDQGLVKAQEASVVKRASDQDARDRAWETNTASIEALKRRLEVDIAAAVASLAAREQAFEATAAQVTAQGYAVKEQTKAQASLQASLNAKQSAIDTTLMGMEKAKLDIEVKAGHLRKTRLMVKALVDKHQLLKDELSTLMDPDDLSAALAE